MNDFLSHHAPLTIAIKAFNPLVPVSNTAQISVSGRKNFLFSSSLEPRAINCPSFGQGYTVPGSDEATFMILDFEGNTVAMRLSGQKRI